jgi:tRNA(Glu) U13 pseudouridine synthase TruD
MLGPKMKASRDEALALEREVVNGFGLGDEELGRLGDFAAGTRRDLFVHPEDLDVDRLEDGSLILQFSLPSGSYATQLVRELTRGPFENSRALVD